MTTQDSPVLNSQLSDSALAFPTQASAPVASQVIVDELDSEAQRKLEVIQSLIAPCDRLTYGQKLREAAEKLGVSVRSIQRLVKRWEQEGLAGIANDSRGDKGKHRISDFWQDFIIKTYKEGNKGSKRMTPKQVAVRVQAKAREIKDEQPPTYRTVLRVLKPIIERQEKAKSIRRPGWRGSAGSVKTRDGEDLEYKHSNHIWQCDHTRVDLLLVDQYGELLSRPWLTTVIDTYSRCVMGVNLGFDAPSSQVVALALRHAILPKKYGIEYKLNCEWGTYGKPQHFYTDGGKDFRSHHVQQVGTDLGFRCHLRDRPSEGGIVERPFRTLNDQLFSTLPGYTGSNVQQRPEDAEKDASLTLRQLEQLIARFICDHYNQSMDARMGDQTRFQRWEAGLPEVPDVIDERHLDNCLMKAARRSVQGGGHLQFENLIYHGEYLAGYAKDIVSLRFDPNDITTILVYRQEDNREVFLARATAKGLETEQLSYEEAKASSRRLRSAGKTLSNEAILQEALERDALADSKKNRKQRQKEEQKLARSQPNQRTEQPASSSTEPEPAETQDEPEISFETQEFEPIDFDELRGDW
jgi:putative transposase